MFNNYLQPFKGFFSTWHIHPWIIYTAWMIPNLESRNCLNVSCLCIY